MTSKIQISRLSLLIAIVSLVWSVAGVSDLNAQAVDFANDYASIRICGNSMLPTLKSGEVTTVYKKYPYRELRKGDVVIVESEKGFSVIHRIVRRYRGNLWVTQGDNNDREDREVLSPKNFAGLALVGESTLARYNQHIAIAHASAPESLTVAKANTNASDLR
ncbi:MAG: signal peptidase I [Opitutales bacterium]|nr:signal peptidase I [Opitutales bacterium]